ncbi:hypothetical protein [Nocardioides sp.]|uniref:hypothetical protein n=1 Tax=Nocardioides sp. TaxID=35761 RepID=UPI00356A351F
MSESPPIHLKRTDENLGEIDALANVLGGRSGLAGLLDEIDDAGRRGRRAFLGGRLLGRAVDRAFTWDALDRRDPRWWPQGVTTSADASESEAMHGRRLLLVSWYAKERPEDEHGAHGSRISVFDLDTQRYEHVLLVVPRLVDGVLSLDPLHIHAGGMVWLGNYLHVAATARGLMTCSLDDILRVPDFEIGSSRLAVDGERVSSLGYRYVLPVRFAYQAVTEEGEERLRYSFLSLDRTSEPMQVVVGEYGGTTKTRRLARYPLDPTTGLLDDEDGLTKPLGLHQEGAVRMQGAVSAHGTWYLTASNGPWGLGTVYVGEPGAWRRHPWATPMGPEDISWWPSTDRFWSVSEHPRRRWLYSMRRDWFDR